MRNLEFVDMTQVIGKIIFFTILLSVSSACLFFGFLISFDPYHWRPALGAPLLIIWIVLLVILAIGLVRLRKSHVRVKFAISSQAGEIAVVSERAWTLIPFLWLPVNVHSVGFLNGGSFRSGRTFFFHFRAVKFARNLAVKFGNGFSEPMPRRIDDFSMALHMAIFSGIWIFLAYAVFSS